MFDLVMYSRGVLNIGTTGSLLFNLVSGYECRVWLCARLLLNSHEKMKFRRLVVQEEGLQREREKSEHTAGHRARARAPDPVGACMVVRGGPRAGCEGGA